MEQRQQYQCVLIWMRAPTETMNTEGYMINEKQKEVVFHGVGN
jgi:hypothetical protein